MTPRLPEGYTAKYKHTRFADGHGNVLPRGGMTRVTVFNADGDNLITDVAFCSFHDNFNKRIGRDIALGRALKQLAVEPGSSAEMYRLDYDDGGMTQ